MKQPQRDISTKIIPDLPTYYDLAISRELDYKAICCFAAIGFFLDDDTYYTNQKAFRPATSYAFDERGNVLKQEPNFQWHYSPRDISFSQALDEFTYLFEKLVGETTHNQRVILPISGGLDSRTLAVALRHRNDVFAYSYEFENGIGENAYGKAIAKECNFDFEGYTIPKGYLWKDIEHAAKTNGCYADFTNPRQVAVLDKLKNKGDVFLLGHWGDVLFDDMGVDSVVGFEEQLAVIKKKVIKKGGAELAQSLWEAWGISGNFDNYLNERLRLLLGKISIDDANARIRAFKSMHWATRWTSSNLTFFDSIRDITLPYYQDAMCKFICSVPEGFLAGRKIQIEYLKSVSPEVASIPWQKYAPANLYTFQKYYSLSNLPGRIIRKSSSLVRSLFNKELVTRNWELQFVGRSNEEFLKSYLLDKSNSNLLPEPIVDTFYKAFQRDRLGYAHSITMLLTLSMFSRLFLMKEQNE